MRTDLKENSLVEVYIYRGNLVQCMHGYIFQLILYIYTSITQNAIQITNYKIYWHSLYKTKNDPIKYEIKYIYDYIF